MKLTGFLIRHATSSSECTRGFTALEAIIAVSLLAIVFAMAAPVMLDTFRNNRLSTAARQLDADILLARREAIKRNARVLVCVVGTPAGTCGSGTAWAGGWLDCYDVDQDGACDRSTSTDPNPILQRGELDSTLLLAGPSTAARFNANGTQGAAGASSLTFTTKGVWTRSKSFVETVTAMGDVFLMLQKS